MRHTVIGRIHSFSFRCCLLLSVLPLLLLFLLLLPLVLVLLRASFYLTFCFRHHCNCCWGMFLPSVLPNSNTRARAKVQLELPRQRSLRTVIDRMKGIDKFLFVDADMGGQLVFRYCRSRHLFLLSSLVTVAIFVATARVAVFFELQEASKRTLQMSGRRMGRVEPTSVTKSSLPPTNLAPCC